METLLIIVILATVGIVGIRNIFMIYNWVVSVIREYRLQRLYLSTIHLAKNQDSDYYRIAVEFVNNPDLLRSPDRVQTIFHEYFANDKNEVIEICTKLFDNQHVSSYKVPKSNSEKPVEKWVEHKINGGYKILFLIEHVMFYCVTDKEQKINIINRDKEEFLLVMNNIQITDKKQDEPTVGFRKEN